MLRTGHARFVAVMHKTKHQKSERQLSAAHLVSTTPVGDNISEVSANLAQRLHELHSSFPSPWTPGPWLGLPGDSARRTQRQNCRRPELPSWTCASPTTAPSRELPSQRRRKAGPASDAWTPPACHEARSRPQPPTHSRAFDALTSCKPSAAEPVLQSQRRQKRQRRRSLVASATLLQCPHPVCH